MSKKKHYFPAHAFLYPCLLYGVLLYGYVKACTQYVYNIINILTIYNNILNINYLSCQNYVKNMSKTCQKLNETMNNMKKVTVFRIKRKNIRKKGNLCFRSIVQ